MGVWGPITARYINLGLRLVRQRSHYCLSRSQVRGLYQEHEGKFFYPSLILAMTSGPSHILVLEGEDAIDRVRALNGDTNPDKAAPGTIRHDFKSGGGPFNTVHASDSPEAVEREFAIIFGDSKD